MSLQVLNGGFGLPVVNRVWWTSWNRGNQTSTPYRTRARRLSWVDIRLRKPSRWAERIDRLHNRDVTRSSDALATTSTQRPKPYSIIHEHSSDIFLRYEIWMTSVVCVSRHICRPCRRSGHGYYSWRHAWRHTWNTQHTITRYMYIAKYRFYPMCSTCWETSSVMYMWLQCLPCLLSCVLVLWWRQREHPVAEQAERAARHLLQQTGSESGGGREADAPDPGDPWLHPVLRTDADVTGRAQRWRHTAEGAQSASGGRATHHLFVFL